jgi:hypothetical protein
MIVSIAPDRASELDASEETVLSIEDTVPDIDIVPDIVKTMLFPAVPTPYPDSGRSQTVSAIASTSIDAEADPRLALVNRTPAEPLTV